MDVSPNCDCHAENDIPIVPDIGMLCSEDMVALDQACADLVNAAEPVKGSQLDKNLKKFANKVAKKDYFTITIPESDWENCLAHGEKSV